jgi:fructose transport system permease protein
MIMKPKVSASASVNRPNPLLILATPPFGPLIALLVVSAYFAFASERFLTGNNLSLIAQQTVVTAILALGQTLIILTAGIDLSNGLVMAFSQILVAGFAVRGLDGTGAEPITPLLAVVFGLSAACAFGMLNGLLVTRVKLPPFIVTLGTLNIAFALTRMYSTSSIPNLPTELTALGETFSLAGTPVTYTTIVMLVLFFIVWFVLSYTQIGRHIYAVGDNPESARLVGIPVNRILLIVYTSAALLYGIAGLMLLARTETGDPQAGQQSNLDSITAVVLGGTSLFGGRGSVIGTLIGALIVSVIRNGLTQMGALPITQTLITGILVIAAVAVDQFSQRAKG